jgi:isocitrate dehydrogenase
MGYQHIKVPTAGEKITVNADLSLNVPDQLFLLSKVMASGSTLLR